MTLNEVMNFAHGFLLSSLVKLDGRGIVKLGPKFDDQTVPFESWAN